MKYQILLLVAVSSTLLLGAQAKPTNCSPGTTFQVKCNICKCNTEGTDMLCTKKICEEEYESGDDKVNNNQESQTGGEMNSVKEEEKKDGEKVEATQESAKPEEKSDNEESPKGEEAKKEPEATQNSENQSSANQVETKSNLAELDTCVPGQSYENECNTCTCPPSGLKSAGVCTLLACH